MSLLDSHQRELQRAKTFLVPAGATVSIHARGSKVAQCFLDSMGVDYAKLIPQMSATVNLGGGALLHSGIRHEKNIIEHAAYLLTSRPSSEVAFELFDEWIGKLNIDPDNVADPRVARAVSLIKENYAENVSVNTVAASVGLSVPRLSQLFKQVTGLPIRRFRLWYRIFATASKIGRGYTLTDAAIASGFADYPQMCRVFRELTGAKPATARDNTEIRVLAECY